MPPLDGLVVVSLEQAVAAPFATRHLADLGARVIKIERPAAGDFARDYDKKVHGLSSFFVWLNRSKESLTLDLKHPAAATVFDRLLTKTDVFVQNLTPGATERLGLGAEALREKHRRLIVCNISGYGMTGPYRNRKAYDLLIQAEAGLLSITGSEENPSKVGISIADIAAGMYAFSGILTALLQRHKTNRGTCVEISMLEALGEWMGSAAYYAMYGGSSPPRSGPSHASIAPYGPFPSLDNRMVYLGVQNEREWDRFCQIVLQRPDLAADERFVSNSRRVANRAALNQQIEAVFRHMSAEQIVERLDGAQVANARMNTIEEFIDHPQLAARDRWRVVGSPVGQLRALVPPVTLSDIEPVMTPIPAIGQHSELILAELGFCPTRISAWRETGVV